MSKVIKDFIETLIDLGLIQSMTEAEILAKITTPGYGAMDWSAVVATAALRAAHKRGK